MRRTVLLLASLALALLLVSGVAWAITKDCKPRADYCIGTNQEDTLNGSEENDRIYGRDANDTLLGNGGNDNLKGDAGEDTIKGGAGVDKTPYGDPGADKTYGDSGDDYLSDSSYRCRADCVDDPNVLKGGSGDDYLEGQNKLFGGSGDDTLTTDAFPETRTVLNGGPGLDKITGASSSDTIYARDGEKDTVGCGGGEDTVYFDEGIDEVSRLNCENRIGK